MYYSAEIAVDHITDRLPFMSTGETVDWGSAEERGFPSGKGRKKPFSAESAIINAFGSIDGVRTV